MSERIIELTWDCRSCKHENKGRFIVCERCGSPKDKNETYKMPSTPPPPAATVTDPALLRLANAGENWTCTFCGSHTRDLDGTCGQCGAGRAREATATPPEPASKRWPRWAKPVALAAAFGLSFGGWLAYEMRHVEPVVLTPPPPIRVPPAPAKTEFAATVERVSWTRTILVEKWQLVAHEGFTEDAPEGALQVSAAGMRVHHYEDVYDHDETVYDDVAVPDGHRSESYTERVSCGQDCKTTPRVCHPVCTRTTRTCRSVCTSKGNGFASCRDVCSGGTESCRQECTGGTSTCTTKYCNETRTKQIPKTRTERRARVVKRYRKEPRNAAWSTWKTWEWAPVREVKDEGDDVAPRWPDAGSVALRDAEAPRAGDEREQRTESMQVVLRVEDGTTRIFVPSSEEELAKLAPGTQHEIEIEGGKITLQRR